MTRSMYFQPRTGGCYILLATSFVRLVLLAAVFCVQAENMRAGIWDVYRFNFRKCRKDIHTS